MLGLIGHEIHAVKLQRLALLHPLEWLPSEGQAILSDAQGVEELKLWFFQQVYTDVRAGP